MIDVAHLLRPAHLQVCLSLKVIAIYFSLFQISSRILRHLATISLSHLNSWRMLMSHAVWSYLVVRILARLYVWGKRVSSSGQMGMMLNLFHVVYIIHTHLSSFVTLKYVSSLMLVFTHHREILFYPGSGIIRMNVHKSLGTIIRNSEIYLYSSRRLLLPWPVGRACLSWRTIRD